MRRRNSPRAVAAGLAALALAACTAEADEPRLFIAGDSTAADYPPERSPQTGWGQALRIYSPAPTRILNRAVNGRSTRSFIDQGKWDALVNELREDDTVLISFGHNDSRDDAVDRHAPAFGAYTDNLLHFISDVRAKGATPVLLSPAARRLWEGPAMVETHGDYRRAMREAAAKAGAAYIDLSLLSLSYFEALDQEATKADFLWLPAGAHPRFPDGVEDNTHFTLLGACGVAYVIAGALADQKIAPEIVRAPPTDAGAQRPAAVEACEGSLSQSHPFGR